MPIIYCANGASTASIIVNNVTYKTNKPPLAVYPFRVNISFKPNNWTYPLNEHYFEITQDLIDDGYVIRREQKVISRGNGNFDFFTHVTLDKIIRDSDRNIIGYQETNKAIYQIDEGNFSVIAVIDEKPLKALDKRGTVIYQHPFLSLIKYKIKCDNCDENECEGTKDEYPGYECLDCRELTRIKRENSRTDNQIINQIKRFK